MCFAAFCDQFSEAALDAGPVLPVDVGLTGGLVLLQLHQQVVLTPLKVGDLGCDLRLMHVSERFHRGADRFRESGSQVSLAVLAEYPLSEEVVNGLQQGVFTDPNRLPPVPRTPDLS
ncbi:MULTISPECIES: hypothetical protein [Actinomadura]|uniref:hypothetical protein n=1 Tax=Actinomadura TaxID=1988 RepID=UPI001268C110|nr:hypothetical protein [Actinomadura madurae]